MTPLNKAQGVHLHTADPMYPWVPHPWIQIIVDQKCLKKSRQLVPKQYSITTTYIVFTLN